MIDASQQNLVKHHMRYQAELQQHDDELNDLDIAALTATKRLSEAERATIRSS